MGSHTTVNAICRRGSNKAEDTAWRCEVSVCAKPSRRMHSDLVSPILLSKEA